MPWKELHLPFLEYPGIIIPVFFSGIIPGKAPRMLWEFFFLFFLNRFFQTPGQGEGPKVADNDRAGLQINLKKEKKLGFPLPPLS